MSPLRDSQLPDRAQGNPELTVALEVARPAGGDQVAPERRAQKSHW